MITLDKLVEIGFSVEQATDISAFFRNVGYLTLGTESVLTGVTIPENKVLVIDSNEALKSTLKADSKEYLDISKVLVQNGNLEPNKGRVNSVILYLATKTETDNYGTLVDEFVSVNGNWSQLLINSTTDEDITAAAAKALANNRLFIAQTESENIAKDVENNIAETLKNLANNNTLLTYHKTANESLAAGLAGIMAHPYLGATGSLYSTVTDVTPEDYTPAVNSNLDKFGVTYYTNINAISGGGVTQYASPIVMNAKMAGGEDAKRRYIRFCVDLLLKVKSIDFLKKKLGYEDGSAEVGLAMLKSVLKACQTNGLIKKNSIVKSGDETIETLGFELRTVYPSELMNVDVTLYNASTYKYVGYYRDSLTGRKVLIDLSVDPSEANKSLLGF